ncbi:amino acid permease [Arthrobacter sp. MYb211]|uniref:APC family permease n=1 Tax=unclassified Arthrobacter TaxID=235627 RepID=UPI000CFCBE66|nr:MULTISPECIES: APC family permease [unclassified Arthrobacter]PRA12345.1 amino acid permease [Arthrobacter sp. MYb221]PRC08808.1 amino acid permease [Arthrobacter sp. MYb211]
MKNSESSTFLAQEQSKHLQKSLGRMDILLLVVAAVISIEVLGQVSGFGGETFTWTLVLAITFMIPYGLIFAETGGAFTEEGGVYVWTKMAFGRVVAAIASLFTWVTQPVWVGGAMAFVAVETWSEYVGHIEAGGVGDYLFKLGFIWITVTSAVISLKHGKWLPSLGAILKILFLFCFLVVTAIYGFKNGFNGLNLGFFSPTMAGFLGVTPLLLFSFLGFESGNSAAGEMKNPAKDVPVSIARTSMLAAASYLLPVLAILLVVPLDEITGIGGLFGAIATVFTVFGPAADAMLALFAIVFCFVLVSQGAAWMIISDRMQAMAAADGSFFGGFFGHFNPKLGTPIRVNTLSGVVATIFMLAAMQMSGSNGAMFGVVLTISISTFLLSYLIAIPAVVMLRFKYPSVVRPFRVPVSNSTFAVLGGICFAWILIGSWIAVFPGSLEYAFGMDYDFEAIWGLSWSQFESFALGTLASILALGIVGYILGRKVREEERTEVDAMAPPKVSVSHK